MMHMAAGVADAVMFSDIQPEMFDRVMPIYKEAVAAQGRESDFPLSNFVAWHVKKDREASLWEARRELIIRGWLAPDWISPYLNEEDAKWASSNIWPFLTAFRARTGDLEGVPEHISDALVEGLTMSGDESDLDRHIERLLKFKAAGFAAIALGIQDDPANSIRMIGERVIPALQS